MKINVKISDFSLLFLIIYRTKFIHVFYILVSTFKYPALKKNAELLCDLLHDGYDFMR